MGQRGFTVIEIFVVLGIMAVLLPVMATSIREITVQTERNSTRITALTPLENAGRRLGQEIPLAQATDLVSGAAPVSQVILYWTDWSDKGNYDTYSAGSAAYKRVRATYALSGANLVRTTATCANQSDADVKCVNLVVFGAGWTNNTRWVVGQPVLTSSGCVDPLVSPGCFNSASRAADPASPVTIARNVTTAQFSRTLYLFTSSLTSRPKGTYGPGETRTYKAYGMLLASTDPIQ